MTDYVVSRAVGAATVAIISDGVGPWAPQLQAPEAEWRREVPEANEIGEFPLEWSVGFVRVGGATMLIDLGFDDPSPRSHWMAPRFQRSPGVEAGLATFGVRPADVTHVLITHPHGDHVAGATAERDGQRVARYPNARYLINRLDWQGNPARDKPESPLALQLGTLERLGQLDLIDGDHRVVPGVTMCHAPGESAGHSAIRVQSGGATAFFFGDLFHHPCEVAHPEWVSPGRDQAVSLVTRRRLLASAVHTNAICTFSHARLPGWGRIVAQGESYRWAWL